MEFLKHYLDFAVFSILGVLSVVALARVIERTIFYLSVDVGSYPDSDSLKIDLTHGLTTVASVASNAPYIGLLGTVFGIMITFHDIGLSGQIDTTSVMSGLALALKATALGLVVAIPSMMFYNALVARSEVLLSLWQIEENRKRARLARDDFSRDGRYAEV